MTRNEIFSCAVDYLYKEGKITGQSELAERTGITETTISRILNNKVRKPSDDSLRRLNIAFGGIFNPRWLRGEGGDMLVNQQPTSTLEVGAEHLISLAAQLIKENESLRRELQESILEVKQIAQMLQNVHISRSYTTSKPKVLKVAEASEDINP